MANLLQNSEMLLFDWSGTISNDRSLIYETNQRLLEAYGQPRLTLDEWRDGREGWNASNFLAKQLGRAAMELYEEFSLLLAEVKVEFGEPQPYPGVIKAIACLTKGKLSEIISSHPQQHLEREAIAYGVSEFVQQIRGSVSDKVLSIKDALQQARVAPEQATYIGDTIQDVRAAQEAGVGAIAVTYGYHSETLLGIERPDMVIGSLEELVEQ